MGGELLSQLVRNLAREVLMNARSRVEGRRLTACGKCVWVPGVLSRVNPLSEARSVNGVDRRMSRWLKCRRGSDRGE